MLCICVQTFYGTRPKVFEGKLNRAGDKIHPRAVSTSHAATRPPCPTPISTRLGLSGRVWYSAPAQLSRLLRGRWPVTPRELQSRSAAGPLLHNKHPLGVSHQSPRADAPQTVLRGSSRRPTVLAPHPHRVSSVHSLQQVGSARLPTPQAPNRSSSVSHPSRRRRRRAGFAASRCRSSADPHRWPADPLQKVLRCSSRSPAPPYLISLAANRLMEGKLSRGRRPRRVRNPRAGTGMWRKPVP
jgi:hypothetical protein